MIYEEEDGSVERESEREGEGKAMNEQLKVWSCRKNRCSQQNRERDNSISLKSEGMEAI